MVASPDIDRFAGISCAQPARTLAPADVKNTQRHPPDHERSTHQCRQPGQPGRRRPL